MKRKPGEGSISWSEARQRFVIAINVNGRQIKRETTKEKDAVKILQDLRRKYGLIRYSGKMNLEDWYSEWLFEVKAQSVKPKTVASHKGVLDNHIKPYPIAKMSLSEITKMDITRFFNQLAKDGKSIQTIQKVKNRLSTCFNEADEFVERNPVKGVNLPRAEDNSRKYTREKVAVQTYNVFDKESQKKLIAALGDNWELDFLLLFLMGSGLRVGEALALTRFDYDGQKIHVKKTLSRIPIYEDQKVIRYDVVFADLKTQNSQRTIPLPKKLKVGLDQRIQEIQRMPQPFIDSGLLFPNAIGQPLPPNKVLRRLHALEEKLDLPYVNTHGLRHTYATRLLEAGEPIQAISKLLGHASVEMTQCVYAHVLDGMKEKAVTKLDAIL